MACGLNIFILCQHMFHIVLILQKWGVLYLYLRVFNAVTGKHVANSYPEERNRT